MGNRGGARRGRCFREWCCARVREEIAEYREIMGGTPMPLGGGWGDFLTSVGVTAQWLAMADRSVHYEAAFEALLRDKRIPYVAVDEAKRALFANAKLKSFDFVVYPASKSRLLIDVKGRQLRNRGKRSGFETWTTEADVRDLLQWEQVFGEGFVGLLAFVYWIDPPLTAEPGMFEFRDRWYMVMGIELAEYRDHMRRRSPKWETVCLPAEDFRSLARPIESWL